jgi:hypothetical protein
MANETLIIGNSNWAGKASSLLGYFIDNASKYYARFITFSRNIAATYINSSGVVTTASANIPRVEYNALLLEPARTNTLLYTDFSTGWIKYGGTISGGIYTENTVNTFHQINDSSTFGYSPNTYYCFSVIFQKVSGEDRSGLIQIVDNTPSSYFYSQPLNLQTGILEGSASIAGGWEILTTNTISLPPENLAPYNNGKYLYYVVARCTNISFSGFRFAVMIYKNGTETYIGNTGNSIQITYPQVELGQFPTSRIATTGSAVTRLTDLISRSNLYSERMITSKGGTMLLELTSNYITNGTTSNQLLGIGNNTSGASADNIWLSYGDDTRASVYKQASGGTDIIHTTQYDNTKIAVRWDGSSIDVFENGVQNAATTFNPVQLQSLRTSTIENPVHIKQLALYATPLDDATCISYTNFDSNVVSFLNATGITNPIYINAINNLVLNYKGKGTINQTVNFWDSIYAIYPLISGSEDTSKYNLKNTAQYTLSFNGTWNFEDPEGISGNGTDSYANTGINPFSVLSPSSGRIGVYINNNVSEEAYDVGAFESSNNTSTVLISKLNSTGNLVISYGDASTPRFVNNTNTKGFFTVNRDSSTHTTAYKNGIEQIYSMQTAGLPSYNLYLGALNNAGTAQDFSSKTYSFMVVGQGLSVVNSILEYQIVQQFQKDLGRAV